MAMVWVVLALCICVQLVSGAVHNAAYTKTATMSCRKTDHGHGPEKAVDNDTRAIHPVDIIDTGPGHQYSWWRVDLEREVQDATVEIYFRTDYKWRRNGVQLYTSASPFSDTDRGQLCYEVSGRPDGADIPDVVSVNCSGSWRYLMVYTQTNNDGQGATLDFGEVRVLVCSAGTYGASCNKTCSHRQCITATESCYRYTGSCSGGCMAGYTGSDCTQACTSGAYGLDCTKSCSSRQCAVTPTSCDRLTGACPSGGCKAGWMGTDCTQMCSAGTYGASCNKSCSHRQCVMATESCDRYAGSCSGGCESGYTGSDCTQACTSGAYGLACTKSCSSRQCAVTPTSCDILTGVCPSGGCKAGWMGTDCTQTESSAAVNITAVVAGSVAAVIVVILIVVVFIIKWRRRGRTDMKDTHGPEPIYYNVGNHRRSEAIAVDPEREYDTIDNFREAEVEKMPAVAPRVESEAVSGNTYEKLTTPSHDQESAYTELQ